VVVGESQHGGGTLCWLAYLNKSHRAMRQLFVLSRRYLFVGRLVASPLRLLARIAEVAPHPQNSSRARKVPRKSCRKSMKPLLDRATIVLAFGSAVNPDGSGPMKRNRG
jgi:hypothetical protein